MVLLDFFSVSNAYPNAPSTIPTVAPYKRFCSFLPCFFSVLLLHSGHTSKLQLFHCFFPCFTHALRDNGPTSEPQFYLASFYPLPILSTVSPRVLNNFPSVLLKFSIAFPIFFHCFMSKSLLFSIVFLIIFPSFPIFSHCFMSYSLIFSIVFLIIFPSIAICPDPPRRADQGGIDTPTSPNCHLVHNPKKVYLWPPFLPPNFLIFVPLGSLCPQTPLTHFVRKNNFA